MKQIKTLRLCIYFSAIFALMWLILADVSIAKPKDKKITQDAQVINLEKKVSSIEQKLSKTIQLVDSLSRKLKTFDTSDKPSNTIEKQIAQMDSSVKTLEMITASLSQDVVRLRRQIELNERRTSYADSINFEILSQLVMLENRIVSLGSSLSETKSISSVETASPALSSTGSYRDRYRQALTFYQNAQNQESIELFRQLLSEDKKNELADNAQYWIGECYYSMKQYRRAIVEFEKVFAFKNTNKDDDAQFKLGLCYAALGEREKAIDELQRLIDYYPQSEYVENAKQFVKRDYD
ncbi:MAG: tetratricopeptide repeat protein [Candidatus Marinimicrobia bacterium]|nr:tetratricopeptide repeat protein [Candidatus Neomarinimicrobiota bacterium]